MAATPGRPEVGLLGLQNCKRVQGHVELGWASIWYTELSPCLRQWVFSEWVRHEVRNDPICQAKAPGEQAGRGRAPPGLGDACLSRHWRPESIWPCPSPLSNPRRPCLCPVLPGLWAPTGLVSSDRESPGQAVTDLFPGLGGATQGWVRGEWGFLGGMPSLGVGSKLVALWALVPPTSQCQPGVEGTY